MQITLLDWQGRGEGDWYSERGSVGLAELVQSPHSRAGLGLRISPLRIQLGPGTWVLATV